MDLRALLGSKNSRSPVKLRAPGIGHAQKRKLLIHIGMGKTGTTSIQRTLYRSANDLMKRGITYPLIAKARDHNLIHSAYRPYEHAGRNLRSKHDLDSYEALAEQYRHDLFATLSRSSNAILSSEMLFPFSEKEVASFRRDISALGWHEIRVIAYIREPSSLYLSGVQQQLKRTTLKIPSPETWTMNSFERLERWRTHFPLEVRAFDRKQLAYGCVASDFLTFASDYFAVPLEPHDFPIAIENISLSAEAMIILQKYRRTFYDDANDTMTRDANRLVEFLATTRSALSQTKPVLRLDLAELIIANHAATLAGLRREYGLDLALPHSGASHPRRISAQPEYAVEEIVEHYDAEIVDRLLWLVLHRSLAD